MKKLFLSLILIMFFATSSFAGTIVIDVGHTSEKPGVISARGNPEIYFNIIVAAVLAKKLSKDHKIFILADLPLQDRVKEINKANPDLVISIHHGSVQEKYLSKWKFEGKEYYYSDKFSGFSIFVSKSNDDFKNSLRFATLVGRFLTESGLYPNNHTEAIPGENRELLNKDYGIYRYDDLVILKTKYPSILLECGIIVNRSDEISLRSDYIINTFTDSITKAVNVYFNHSL